MKYNNKQPQQHLLLPPQHATNTSTTTKSTTHITLTIFTTTSPYYSQLGHSLTLGTRGYRPRWYLKLLELVPENSWGRFYGFLNVGICHGKSGNVCFPFTKSFIKFCFLVDSLLWTTDGTAEEWRPLIDLCAEFSNVYTSKLSIHWLQC